MNFRIKAYLFILAALPLVLQSQTYRYNAANRELVYVHLDKLTYVAGETVRYKAYLADAQNPGKIPCSRILYFTLSGGQEPLTWRINLKGKSAAGSFLLPENLKEGMYTLTAYTNWMLNGPPESYFSQKLILVSLSEETAGFVRLLPRSEINNQPVDAVSGSTMKVTVSKEIFKPGESIEAEISLTGNDTGSGADISVSVSADNPFNDDLGLKHISSAMPLVKKSAGKEPVLPVLCSFPIEDRGFILSGRIIMPQGNKISSPCNVWLSVADSLSSALLYTLTDSTGGFRFYLGSRYDNKNLILQLADPEKNADCRLEVFSKTVNSDTVRTAFEMDSTHRAYINTVEDIRMIEAVYRSNNDSPLSPAEPMKISFFEKPHKVIIPAEYAEMRNFKEIANNIVPEIRFNVRNEKFHLLVLSPANTWRENYTVLLNGVPFNDLAYISTLGTKEIKRIDIYKSNMLIGDMTLPGLVCIYTYDLKIPENYLKSHTVQFFNTVFEVKEEFADETIQGTNNAHFPDFRNSVYWNPFVKLTNGRAIIRFPAILLEGQFTIDVEGITGAGIPVTTSGSFEIKE
jgi:hypothetical protein